MIPYTRVKYGQDIRTTVSFPRAVHEPVMAGLRILRLTGNMHPSGRHSFLRIRYELLATGSYQCNDVAWGNMMQRQR